MHVFWLVVMWFGIAVVVIAGGLALLLSLVSDAPKQTSARPKPRPSPAQQVQAEQQAKIVCQFCQQVGSVTARRVKRRKRTSATRVVGGVMTMGGSLGVTGVSKKGTVTELHCSNCGMTWDAPLAKP